MNDTNDVMALRIKTLRKQNGLSQEQLADLLGLQKSAIAKYENGRVINIKRSTIAAMANIFHCTPSYIMGWSDEPDKQISSHISNKAVQIKVLGRVAAGIPLEAIEDVIDTEEIPQSLAKTGEFFGLQIHGDSMEPRMCEGDVVIVRQQDDAESGDIVIAMINGHDATCKRLMKYTGGISLLSFNPLYEPMMFSNEEIETKPVRIIGKVVENRQKY